MYIYFNLKNIRLLLNYSYNSTVLYYIIIVLFLTFFYFRAKKDKVKGFYINNKSIHVGREEFLELYHSNSTKRSSPLLLQTIITDEIYGDFSMTTYFDVIPGTKKYSFYINNLKNIA